MVILCNYLNVFSRAISKAAYENSDEIDPQDLLDAVKMITNKSLYDFLEKHHREHEVDSVFPELKEINGHELGSKTAKTLAALSECMCAELLALVSGKISESDSGTSKFDEIIAEDEDMTDCFDNCHLYLDEYNSDSE